MTVFDKVIMKVNPDFYSLSKEEQNHFKLLNECAIEFEFKKRLYKEVLNAEIKNEDDILEIEELDFDLNEEMEIAKQSLYFHGVGNDYFYFNENIPSNISQHEISTFHDFDYISFFEKESLKSSSFVDIKKEGYIPFSHTTWARAIFNNPITKKDEVKYLTLESLYVYINFVLEDFESDYLNVLFPFYINVDKDDMAELLRKTALKRDEIYKELQTIFFEEKNDFIYQRKVLDESGYPCIYYIFNSIGSTNVFIDNWQKETDKITNKNISELDCIEEKYKKVLKEFIDKESQKIVKKDNFSNVIDVKF